MPMFIPSDHSGVIAKSKPKLGVSVAHHTKLERNVHGDGVLVVFSGKGDSFSAAWMVFMVSRARIMMPKRLPVRCFLIRMACTFFKDKYIEKFTNGQSNMQK